ncbi:hypothetical protein HDU77_011021 [Chytriomyces hyalinus]|nr:hypothetical protein HDU77_011021 [Chytriomyces hyalinus]
MAISSSVSSTEKKRMLPAAKIVPPNGSATASTTPAQVMQAKSEAVPKKRGWPSKNASATMDGSTPAVQAASWMTVQVESLLHHRYDSFRSEFMAAKSKEEMADGWRKVQAALNADMEVEYTVEQCKAKVTALKALWSKLKSEEGLSGVTLGDAEDGVTILQDNADGKFQRFMASNSRGSVAGSSTSTVSSSGSLAGIDSDTDSLGDTVDGGRSNATSSKTPAKKRQKRTEQEEADMMTQESIGLPPAVASKLSETNPSKAEPKPCLLKSQ